MIKVIEIKTEKADFVIQLSLVKFIEISKIDAEYSDVTFWFKCTARNLDDDEQLTFKLKTEDALTLKKYFGYASILNDRPVFKCYAGMEE